MKSKIKVSRGTDFTEAHYDALDSLQRATAKDAILSIVARQDATDEQKGTYSLRTYIAPGMEEAFEDAISDLMIHSKFLRGIFKLAYYKYLVVSGEIQRLPGIFYKFIIDDINSIEAERKNYEK